jgi:hypothetical protein
MRDGTLAQVPDAIKQLQGSVPLFTLLPCDDPTVAAGGAAASAAGSHSFSLNPRLHGGELVELFARSGVGKTEMLYQCVATTLLPKVDTHSTPPFSLPSPDIGLAMLCDAAVALEYEQRRRPTGRTDRRTGEADGIEWEREQ